MLWNWVSWDQGFFTGKSHGILRGHLHLSGTGSQRAFGPLGFLSMFLHEAPGLSSLFISGSLFLPPASLPYSVMHPSLAQGPSLSPFTTSMASLYDSQLTFLMNKKKERMGLIHSIFFCCCLE